MISMADQQEDRMLSLKSQRPGEEAFCQKVIRSSSLIEQETKKKASEKNLALFNEKEGPV